MTHSTRCPFDSLRSLRVNCSGQAVLLAAALLLGQDSGARSASYCAPMKITAYVRTDYGPNARTFDGTSIYTDEPIVAASWDIPIGHYVDIAGLGVHRVADRGGGLGSSGWLDVAVWDRATAYALTGVRRACVMAPWELG